MAEGYWIRQPPPHSAAPMAKRPRPEFDQPPGAASGPENFQYLPRDDNRAGFHALKDTRTIEESYERYLQNAQRPSFDLGEASNFSGSGVGKGVSGGMHSLPYWDSLMMGGPGPMAVRADMAANVRGRSFGGELPMDPTVWQVPPGRELPLPPDASNTIFVEGLPLDIKEREVAHIFRPFLGYKEVRIVTKDPKYNGADPVLLCFVDFMDAATAMRAMNALHGYMIDEKDPDSRGLRLQFSRSGPRSGHGSGPRSSHGSRGRR